MVAGALADRSDRRRMMFLADLGRAAPDRPHPVSVLLGGPTLAVILIVTAPMSVLRSFFLAGYGLGAVLVGRSQLARANSIFEAIYSFGFIIGPAIAGILAATIGPGLTLAIDAASFALSSLVLRSCVATCAHRPSTAPRASPRTSVRASTTSSATRSCAR